MKRLLLFICFIASMSYGFAQDTTKNAKAETWVKKFYNIDASKKAVEKPREDTVAKIVEKPKTDTIAKAVVSQPVVPETNVVKSQIPARSIETKQSAGQNTIQAPGTPVFNNPQPNPAPVQVATPAPYRRTRLGSSSPLYNTYKKNDNGAGAITTNSNKWGGGGESAVSSANVNQASTQKSAPMYRDTRLGSSSPLYNTYEKNDNGAGAVTTNPNKWGNSGGADVTTAIQTPVARDTANRQNTAATEEILKKNSEKH